jgi:hypothetical protein
MKLLTPDTQVLRKGRQVVMHFPRDIDAAQFMECLTMLETTPMVVKATMQKPAIRPPESHWTLILEALGIN